LGLTGGLHLQVHAEANQSAAEVDDMIGSFILGGLFFLAATKFARRHHGWGHGGCGSGGWGHRGWGHSHHHHGRGGWERHDEYAPGASMGEEPGEGDGFFRGGWGRGRGTPFYLRFLAQRLDASPDQERAMADAVKQFRADVEPLAGEASRSRADLAAAMRKSSFDEVMLGELFARHDDALEKGRKAVVGLGARLHNTLDERQRDRLATLIERGPRFGRHW
jgi:uncharacterized membrane protein